MSKHTRLGLAAVAIAGLALCGGKVWAVTLPAMNLVDLIRGADSILLGEVTAVTDGIDPIGLPYTEITIAISETLRGGEQGTYALRQFGLKEPRLTPDGTMRMMVAPEGIPRYSAGESVLLFLNPSASITGLRSTVGLGHGKFRLGGSLAENDLGNAGIFANISLDPGLANENDQRILTTRLGAVNNEDFVSLVRRAVTESWVETCKMWKTDEGTTCLGSAN